MPTMEPGSWYADPAHFLRPSRRDILRAGWLGGLGLSLGAFLKLEAAARAADLGHAPEPKAKSVIHI
jgi:hypothetical protein